MSLKNLTEEELEEKFEMFIFNIDDCLEQFIEKTEGKNILLDYSVPSLKLLENYLVENKITINDDDYNDAASYLGEVIRRNYEGKWICNLDKENNSLYYGFPVITKHVNYDILYSPFHVVKAFLLRHKENLFITSIESQLNPQKIDLSDLPDED
ncbi:hypothetical protein [Pedobacter sp. N23S346]|uniref:hypothetical protein n=1 Tax=Pedobacter sp. N23S346 TaxID=3402750 RepID=UPI003AC4235A